MPKSGTAEDAAEGMAGGTVDDAAEDTAGGRADRCFRRRPGRPGRRVGSV